jgi:hypothetical protein
MQPSLRNNIPDRIVTCSVLAWLVLMAGALMQTFAGAGKTGASASYSHGVLRVVIPYHAAHQGSSVALLLRTKSTRESFWWFSNRICERSAAWEAKTNKAIVETPETSGFTFLRRPISA